LVRIHWDGPNESLTAVGLKQKEVNLSNKYLKKEGQAGKTPAYMDTETATYNYVVVIFELQAAACDQCMASPVGIGTSDNHTEVDDEVVFYDENYRHMIQVDWELRSGGWAFEVPYVEPGMILTQQKKEVTTQNWWDYITHDFLSASHGNIYTGHLAAWGMPFKGTTTQLTCTKDKQNSKYDKIKDFHLNFNPKTASYRALKKDDTNEIKFGGGNSTEP
jgi:hypothetical protein